MQRVLLTGLLLGLMTCGCSQSRERVASAPPATPQPNDLAPDNATPAPRPGVRDRMIVELVGRNDTVQILADVHGLKYSVLVGDTLVANAVSAEQLRFSHPHIYQRIHESHASSSDTFEWAGMNVAGPTE